MLKIQRLIGVVALAVGLAGSPARAQFFGGGFWGEGMGFGVGTAEGDITRAAGMYAMGMGRYNLETAKAASIDADTWMRWNEYMHGARLEAARAYRDRVVRQQERRSEGAEALRLRLRNSPNQVDIGNGNALNVALDELNAPAIFPKAAYAGSKVKLGGQLIRDIPFQYAAAAISISVQQLVNGDPPAPLRRGPFAPDVAAIRAVVAELRQQSEELGEDKPETIKKAKDLIMALKAKAEATLGKTTQDFRDANRYLRALYGLASMLETPAVNLLLAGVENRPEATLGDLMVFMSDYNLRFGAATTTRQRQVYATIFPMLAKLREDVIPAQEPAARVATAKVEEAPQAVFDDLGYNSAEVKKPAPAPTPAAPK